MESEDNKVDCVINKIATTIDGGINLTLGLGETSIPLAAWLLEVKRQCRVVEVTFKIKDSGYVAGKSRLSKN